MKEKIKEALLRPKWWFLLVFYLLFAAVLAAVVCCLIFDCTQTWWVYILYAISGVMLAYGVYTAVYLAPKGKRAFLSLVSKGRLTSALVHDYGFRTTAFAIFSFSLDLAYAVFEFVFAFVVGSAWLAVLASYYALLAFLRGSVLVRRRNISLVKREGGDTGEMELRAFRACGITLIVLSFTMLGSVVQINPLTAPVQNIEIYLIALAAYTFLRWGFPFHISFAQEKFPI